MVLYEPSETKNNTYLKISDCRSLVQLLLDSGYKFRNSSLYSEVSDMEEPVKKRVRVYSE